MIALHATTATRTHGSFWTPEEIARAKHMRLVERKSASDIAAELGRTPATVYTQLPKFGAVIEEHRRWTCAMRGRLVEVVREHGLTAAAKEFAIGEEGARYQLKMAGTSIRELRPRPVKLVEATAAKTSRPMKAERIAHDRAARYWTTTEDERLRQRAKVWTADSGPDYDALVADFPGRTREAIRLRLRTLGIEVTGKMRRSGREAAVVAAINAGLHQSELVRQTGVRHRTVLAIAERLGLTIKTFVAQPTQRTPIATARKNVSTLGIAQRRDSAGPMAKRQPAAITERVGRPVVAPKAIAAAPVVAEKVERQPAIVRTIPEAIQLQPSSAKAHRVSTFNTWRKREVGKVARDASLDALIAAHIASKGVTRVGEAPHEAALTRLRRRGYVVIREGDAVVVDHRHRLAGPAEILAFADARGIA